MQPTDTVLADLIDPGAPKGSETAPKFDCDALLSAAGGMLDALRVGAASGEGIDREWCRALHDEYARRIREACGEAST